MEVVLNNREIIMYCIRGNYSFRHDFGSILHRRHSIRSNGMKFHSM